MPKQEKEKKICSERCNNLLVEEVKSQTKKAKEKLDLYLIKKKQLAT